MILLTIASVAVAGLAALFFGLFAFLCWRCDQAIRSLDDLAPLDF